MQRLLRASRIYSTVIHILIFVKYLFNKVKYFHSTNWFVKSERCIVMVPKVP